MPTIGNAVEISSTCNGKHYYGVITYINGALSGWPSV